MKKIALGILIGVVTVVLTVGVALALPEKAKIASPAINDAGNVVAPPEEDIVAPPSFVTPFPSQLPESELTKIVFIRYAPGFAKDKPCNSNGVCDPNEGGWCSDCKGGEEPTTACYTFLSGAKPKWNWVEGYYYSTSELGTASAWATDLWNGVTSATIFGDGVSGTYPWGKYDYYNSISYDNYPEDGVLAVTAIWFRGKNIYEYDIMFDTDYPWGDATVDPTVFDLPTVTLHEFGHGAGLNDLYDAVCSGNVMYWQYTGVKGTLAEGDVTGIQTLYGK